jgi:hypothetical protein
MACCTLVVAMRMHSAAALVCFTASFRSASAWRLRWAKISVSKIRQR